MRGASCGFNLATHYVACDCGVVEDKRRVLCQKDFLAPNPFRVSLPFLFPSSLQHNTHYLPSEGKIIPKIKPD